MGLVVREIERAHDRMEWQASCARWPPAGAGGAGEEAGPVIPDPGICGVEARLGATSVSEDGETLNLELLVWVPQGDG